MGPRWHWETAGLFLCSVFYMESIIAILLSTERRAELHRGPTVAWNLSSCTIFHTFDWGFHLAMLKTVEICCQTNWQRWKHNLLGFDIHLTESSWLGASLDDSWPWCRCCLLLTTNHHKKKYCSPRGPKAIVCLAYPVATPPHRGLKAWTKCFP